MKYIINPSIHPMAVQPLVETWPPIIPSSKPFYSAQSPSSYDTRDVWQHLFVHLPPIKTLALPIGQLPVNSAFRAFLSIQSK